MSIAIPAVGFIALCITICQPDAQEQERWDWLDLMAPEVGISPL